jgi:MULE transposase domain
MASPNARIALQGHRTYPALAMKHREAWLREMDALGDLARPVRHEEVFASKEECVQRLDAWGFAAGYRWVTGRSRATDRYPSWQFLCSFHGNSTANRRGLEAEVVRDDTGKVLSNRQRDTVNRRLECPAKYGLSKRVNKESGEAFYLGKWIKEAHAGHPDPIDPFEIGHLANKTTTVRQLKQRAQIYREVSMPYSEARILLAQEGLGFNIRQKDYYNLVRHERLSNDPHSAAGLLKALDEAGFKHQAKVKIEYEEGSEIPMNRKLVQIVFWLEEGVNLVQQFISGHLLQLDATFSTNSHRMPLITSVGVSNEGTIFPMALSYCPGETMESYSFFIDTIKTFILGKHVPLPRVVLTDSSAGMFSSITHSILPNVQHQLCNWHFAKAMVTHIRNAGYTSEEMNGKRDDNGV